MSNIVNAKWIKNSVADIAKTGKINLFGAMYNNRKRFRSY